MGARNIRIVEAVGSNPICSMLKTLDFSRVFLFVSVEDFKYFLLFGYYLGTTQYISRAVRSVALVQVSLNRRAPVPFMPALRTRSDVTPIRIYKSLSKIKGNRHMA